MTSASAGTWRRRAIASARRSGQYSTTYYELGAGRAGPTSSCCNSWYGTAQQAAAMFDRFETMATEMRRPGPAAEASTLLPPPGQSAPGWSAAPPKKLRLEWKKAEQLVETHALRSWTVLGRDALCHIHLAHPSSSRRHAAIGHHRNGRCYVMDLGSSHGTIVDGTRCKPNRPHPLWEGSSLQFGGSSRRAVLLGSVPTLVELATTERGLDLQPHERVARRNMLLLMAARSSSVPPALAAAGAALPTRSASDSAPPGKRRRITIDARVSFINDELLVERVGAAEASAGRFASLVASTTVPMTQKAQSGERGRQPPRGVGTAPVPARRVGARFQRFQRVGQPPLAGAATPTDATRDAAVGRAVGGFLDGLPPTATSEGDTTLGDAGDGTVSETPRGSGSVQDGSTQAACEAREKEALIERGTAAVRSLEFAVAANVFRKAMQLDPADTVLAEAAAYAESQLQLENK